MKLLKSAAKYMLHGVTQVHAQLALRRLRASGSVAAERLSRAIQESFDDALTPQDRLWVQRIELLRATLRASQGEVKITDYGAGTPDSHRDAEEMHRGVQSVARVSEICQASKPYFWAVLLFKLVREFKPASAVELGTCVGISAAYQAAAQTLNQTGRFTTLEGADELATMAQENLDQLQLHNATVVSGRFQDNLPRVLSDNQPIDYAFIDGHHDEQATLEYYESFLPCLAERAVIVFDDISWSDGMRRAWERIAKRDEVRLAVDCRIIGICVLDGGIRAKKRVRLWLR